MKEMKNKAKMVPRHRNGRISNRSSCLQPRGVLLLTDWLSTLLNLNHGFCSDYSEFAEYPTGLTGTFDENVISLMSVVDKYDGNHATLTAWLVVLEKHVDHRVGDLKAKKSLAYLHISGPLQKSWKDFSDVLIARYGLLHTPLGDWPSLTRIRQSPVSSTHSVADWMSVTGNSIFLKQSWCLLLP